MRQIFIDGRIGKDAEVLSTNGGTKYVKFSLANNYYANKETKTEWFEVISYDKFIIESLSPYLTKGKPIFVIGTPSARISIDKTGKVWLNQDINARVIEFIEGGAKKEDTPLKEGATSSSEKEATVQPNDISNFNPGKEVVSPAPKNNSESFDDDDLPF